jgi:hypothetical protein
MAPTEMESPARNILTDTPLNPYSTEVVEVEEAEVMA